MTTVIRRAKPSWTRNSWIPPEEAVELVGVVEVVVGLTVVVGAVVDSEALEAVVVVAEVVGVDTVEEEVVLIEEVLVASETTEVVVRA